MLLALTTLFLLLSSSLAQDVLTVLSQQKNISQFTAILQRYPDIIQDLNVGQNTVIVPSDAAISSSNVFNSSTSSVEALLRYHIIRDIYPSATFNTTPFFPPTWLTNTSYTNVTGGQRVELVRQNGVASVLSAIKAPSVLIQPDVFFTGGLIHVVDAPLTIPLSFPETITGAGLSSLVALLNKGGWLSEEYLDLVTLQPDLTVFGPNNSAYGANFNGFDNLTKQDRDIIFRNALVAGNAIYSSSMTNSSSYTTLANLSLVITASGKDLWADRSYISSRDYLTTNGVLQVIDSVLNPAVAGLRPNPVTFATPIPSSTSHQSLSTAAQVGLGIGAVTLGIGAIISLALYCRVRRRKHRAPPRYQQSSKQDFTNELQSRSLHSRQSDNSEQSIVHSKELPVSYSRHQENSPELQKKPQFSYMVKEDMSNIERREVKHSSAVRLAEADRPLTAKTTTSNSTLPLYSSNYELQPQNLMSDRTSSSNNSPTDTNNLNFVNETLPPPIGIAVTSPALTSIQLRDQNRNRDRNSSVTTTTPTTPRLPSRSPTPSSLRRAYYTTTPIRSPTPTSTSTSLARPDRESHLTALPPISDKAMYTLAEISISSPLRLYGLDLGPDSASASEDTRSSFPLHSILPPTAHPHSSNPDTSLDSEPSPNPASKPGG